MNAIPARLGVQQRVLPAYRAPFFDALARACPSGLSVFAGSPQPHEGIFSAGRLDAAQLTLADNQYLSKMPSTVWWQRNLIRWLEAWQPQTLIVEANPRNLSLPVAVRWMHTRRRAVIGWGLGAPSSRRSRLQFHFYRAFVRQFDALIAYSQRGAEDFISLGFPAEKVFIARNAAVSRPTSPPPHRPEQGYAGRPVVLFVGRLQERKRVDLLLQACAGLPDELRPRLWIVGDGPAREDLQRLAREIYPDAEFLGPRHGPELDEIFDRADLFVLPGTGGLAVQQAMAHALPVIVGEADGTQEDLVRPTNGWAVQPGAAAALCAALRSALEDPARLRRFGTESYRIVTEEINLEGMVAAFEQAVRAVYPSCVYI